MDTSKNKGYDLESPDPRDAEALARISYILRGITGYTLAEIVEAGRKMRLEHEEWEKNQPKYFFGATIKLQAEQILEPDWENVGKVHDWRNYIPLELQGIWDKLSLETKHALHYTAYEQASREEWGVKSDAYENLTMPAVIHRLSHRSIQLMKVSGLSQREAVHAIQCAEGCGLEFEALLEYCMLGGRLPRETR